MSSHANTLPGYTRLTIDELDDNGCLNLIEGIVERAATDWKRDMLTQGQYHPMAKEVEHFFESQYFHDLTNLNGKTVIKKLWDGYPDMWLEEIYGDKAEKMRKILFREVMNDHDG